ncbi:MAG: hypothetical protein GXO11_01365 [Epsilonproteobacteria bacterium]|nr:hypothetical protein [Campylobacterota bacterium]
MTYVLTATKTEAQALVEYFRLKKKGTIFYNENMEVHISGVGVENAYSYAKKLQPQVSLEDIVINIGIAAAPHRYSIGELVKIKEVFFEGNQLIISNQGEILLTCNVPQNVYQEKIVDMEAYGFAKVFSKYNLKIYKVVSDHFEPEKVKKDTIKKLIKATLKEIF